MMTIIKKNCLKERKKNPSYIKTVYLIGKRF